MRPGKRHIQLALSNSFKCVPLTLMNAVLLKRSKECDRHQTCRVKIKLALKFDIPKPFSFHKWKAQSSQQVSCLCCMRGSKQGCDVFLCTENRSINTQLARCAQTETEAELSILKKHFACGAFGKQPG